jgi:hypothetical protein
MQTETRLPVLVLEWLREHGTGTAPRIAWGIGRDAGLVNACLRKYEGSGYVRRVGEEPNPRGRAATIYELVPQDNDDEEVAEMDAATNGASAAAESPEPGGVTAEELAAAQAMDNLTADDMDELVSGYCGQVSLCEADSRVLLFVLRMRRVQDRLRAVEAAT